MPKRTLTVPFLESLKPGADTQEFWDQDTVGLGLRVYPTGRKMWMMMYRHHRRQRRLNLGVYPAVPLTEARKKVRKAIGLLADQIDPAAERDASRANETFRELATRYFNSIKPTENRPATRRTWREM